MGKIRILAPDIIDKLRAGEVVERPASALKELLENALDAGARRIVIEAAKGGKRLISVTDDGEGMEPEDAILAIQRHSTSKLERAEDLFNVSTFGFRGEALPSIASVSRLVLRSAPRGRGEGLEIEAEGGAVLSQKPAAQEGTTVIVRDLFFNTPARKKFLKSDQTESMHIIGAVTREALARPRSGFGLVLDGQEVMELPPARDERERIAQVYGAEFMEGLVPVEASSGETAIKGFVSRSGNLRGTRSHQFIFVNGRPVKDQAVAHAAASAFEGAQGRHPILFLYLDTPPHALDVNVHPRKEEVRFKDKEALYRLTRKAVLDAVAGAEEARLGAAPMPERPFTTENAPPALRAAEAAIDWPERKASGMPLPLEFPPSGKREFLRVGEMFYACPASGGLMLIDQHAAHERINYERLLEGQTLSKKLLLFPRQIELPPAEYRLITDSLELLGELGMEVEDFGQGTVLLRSVPEGFEETSLEGLLLDAAGGLFEGGRGPVDEVKRNVAARLACHSSVRGSQSLSPEELERLIIELDKCRDPEHCPHGRPTRVLLTMDEIKRIFRRK